MRHLSRTLFPIYSIPRYCLRFAGRQSPRPHADKMLTGSLVVFDRLAHWISIS